MPRTTRDLERAIEGLEKKTRQQTEQEKLQATILGTLEALAGQRITEDKIIQEGTRLVLPLTMTPSDAIDYLSNYVQQQETSTDISRVFKYRPYDGAAAVERALKRLFGSAGIGLPTWTFFGRQPPELTTVEVGVNDTIQVPWGRLKVPSFEGEMVLGATGNKDYGPLFALTVQCPRKYKAHVEGFFTVVEDELKKRSIYKGKAVDGAETPGFVDLTGVNPRNVIYSDETIVQLQANIWSVLMHTQTLRELNIPRKRAVLLEGPYGTGKTLAAFLTAQIATAHGWGFIYCRPATDNLKQVMGLARLYQPCVVFFEDIDTVASSGEADAVTTLLDMFDGITAKGTEILAVLTTNHPERIHKAMVRPGRLDAIVHIGALDAHGIERMIQATVPEHMIPELDYLAIADSMGVGTEDAYLPAFVKEAIDRTLRYAISRGDGVPDKLETADFIGAALGLKAQLELMKSANEGRLPDPLEVALRKNFQEAMHGSGIVDSSGIFGQVDREVLQVTKPGNGK